MFDSPYPAQAVIVSTRGKTSLFGKEMTKDNIMTVAWHSPLSFDPKLYGISIGKSRFSCALIQESKVFAVNFVPHELKEKVIFCGKNSGMHVDKFMKSGLTKEECETIDCCRIGEASAFLECEVIDAFDAGDHIFFVGKVIKEQNNNDKKRLIYLGSEKFSTTI